MYAVQKIPSYCTVNHESFVAKIFSDTGPWLMQKLNVQKYVRNINDNAVQDHLSENYLL